jgi:signal transduction histidine kinase
MGSRANAGYWRALAASDALVAQSPPGILPESMHQELNLKLIPVIDEIVSQARALVVSYQRSVDNEMKAIAEETARRDALNLTLLYLFIATASLFLYLNTRFNLRNYKKAREDIERERAALESARIEVTKLQDLDSAKNALISNVNHELRTPLTSIIGYIELLQNEDRDAQSPEHRLHLEVLQRNSLILLNLVESLLSLSKFDGAVGMLPNTPVSLQAVIDDALFTLKPALEKSQIEAEFTFDRDYTVRGDRAQLNQVIINVVANSIKFSHPHKKIRITLSSRLSQQAKESVVISISDEGIGIPESEISLIFDRFYRSKSLPSDRYEGTGLGLAIVKQVVDHHFGEIEVHSTLGAGTLFEIVLPLLERKDNE